MNRPTNLCTVAAAGLLLSGHAHAQYFPYFSLLHTFRTNGAPIGGLLRLSDGTLVGTTSHGGLAAQGTVFTLRPPAVNGTNWFPSTIHGFNGRAEGGVPLSGVAASRSGVLYGTTSGTSSGIAALGTIYALTPSGTSYSFTTLHDFKAAEGSRPVGALAFIQPSLGQFPALYGTTTQGGAFGAGTVYELAPPAIAGGAWVLTTLYSFTGGADGSDPAGKLLINADGSLTGTTTEGGNVACAAAVHGCGTVFQLTPPATAGGAWQETVLYSFNGADGVFPTSGVLADRQGNLYGTTAQGGVNGAGTIYGLTPPASGSGPWSRTDYHDFGGVSGTFPVGGLASIQGDAFYGATVLGGAFGDGVVYRLVLRPGRNPAFAVIHNFSGGTDYAAGFGANPIGGLALSLNPKDQTVIYGTTEVGGTPGPGNNAAGTAFAIAPELE